MQRHALLLGSLVLVSFPVACSSAASDSDAESGESDLKKKKSATDAGAGADADASTNALAKLPPGTYLVPSLEPTNPINQRGMVLTVSGGSTPPQVAFTNCGPSAVRADGTFTSPARTVHTEDTIGDPGWEDHPWVSDSPRPNGWSWYCVGTVSFDGENLAYELDEVYTAPSSTAHLFKGQLNRGSVLLQAAVSNGGKFGPDVQSVVELPSYSFSDPPFQAVLFRTADGRRFMGAVEGGMSKIMPMRNYLAVELGPPGTVSWYCENEGQSAIARPPGYYYDLPCHGQVLSIREVASTSSQQGGVQLSLSAGHLHESGIYPRPTWF